MEPTMLANICNKAVEEVRLLPSEELFACTRVVSKMVFVIQGTLTYCPRDEINTLWSQYTVEPGEWACEEAIWAAHAVITGPFVARHSCCEILMLSAAEVQDLGRTFPSSVGFLSKYAQIFIHVFNSASSDETLTNLLFNDFDLCEDMVQSSCIQLSGLNKLRSVSTLQNLEEIGKKSAGLIFGQFGKKIKTDEAFVPNRKPKLKRRTTFVRFMENFRPLRPSSRVSHRRNSMQSSTGRSSIETLFAGAQDEPSCGEMSVQAATSVQTSAQDELPRCPATSTEI